MRNKTQESYILVFIGYLIIEYPTNLIIGFYLAAFNGIKEIFPNANIQGYNFHFN